MTARENLEAAPPQLVDNPTTEPTTQGLIRRSVMLGLAAAVSGSANASPQRGPGRAESGLAALPPIDGPLQANVWTNPWAPATWDKVGGVYPWRSDNATLNDGALVLRVTNGAAASVQANGDQSRGAGLFEMDATLPQGLPGLIIAPLYLYGEDGHEIDFEIVGTKGLQLAVHTREQFNAYSHLIRGDFSGRRRFSIRYLAGREISWLVDGVVIKTLRPSEMSSTFPYHSLKPYAEIWPTTSVAWAGEWQHRDTEMTLHGYRLI